MMLSIWSRRSMQILSGKGASVPLGPAVSSHPDLCLGKSFFVFIFFLCLLLALFGFSLILCLFLFFSCLFWFCCPFVFALWCCGFLLSCFVSCPVACVSSCESTWWHKKLSRAKSSLHMSSCNQLCPDVMPLAFFFVLVLVLFGVLLRFFFFLVCSVLVAVLFCVWVFWFLFVLLRFGSCHWRFFMWVYPGDVENCLRLKPRSQWVPVTNFAPCYAFIIFCLLLDSCWYFGTRTLSGYAYFLFRCDSWRLDWYFTLGNLYWVWSIGCFCSGCLASLICE